MVNCKFPIFYIIISIIVIVITLSYSLFVLNRDPITALTQNNIGTILKTQGKYNEAEEYYLKSLKVRQ